MIARNKESACMVPGCTRPVGSSRAVCVSCYAIAKRLVEKQESTWEELEALGLVLPAKSRMASPLRTALAVARESQTKAKAAKYYKRKEVTNRARAKNLKG